MVANSDHVTPVTGLTPTVTLSKSGAAFGAAAGAVTEIANGWYKVAGNATDTGTLGPLVLHATGTGADPCDIYSDVVAFDPQSASSLGLSNLDATVSSRMATFTLPTNFSVLGISLAGKINGVVLVDTLTTYTGNTVQTGDSFVRIGAAGAGLTLLATASELVKVPKTGQTNTWTNTGTLEAATVAIT